MRAAEHDQRLAAALEILPMRIGAGEVADERALGAARGVVQEGNVAGLGAVGAAGEEDAERVVGD